MNEEPQKITRFINVGVLDIRNAGDVDLGKVDMVNVGYILHTPETLDLLKGGRRINVGSLITADPSARVLLSTTRLNNDYFSQQETGIKLLAFGPIIVEWDTSTEAIESSLIQLDLYGGPLICPKHLIHVLQSKVQNQKGEIMIYENASAQFVMGKLVLDKSYLNALEEQSELVVVGSLKIPDVLPNDVLQEKIKRLHLQGGITCHEENAATIQSFLDGRHHKMKTIPAGYTLIEKPLLLNTLALESLKDSRLYCMDWVKVGEDVPAELLDKNLKALISKEQVYCPVHLKDIMVEKCDWQKTTVDFYQGELWIIEDERTLPSHAFDPLKDVATLVVFGELKIDPEIKPETLSNRLDKIHNFGSIRCTPEQMDAVQPLLRSREGRLIDTSKPKQKKKEKQKGDVYEESYVNANYVRL